MSALATLKPKAGSRHRRKLLGRGRGSGKGQTSGRGGKGQKARKGAPIRRGFEGGQTPLSRRMPKFGFSNERFRIRLEIVNLSQLSNFSGEVDAAKLKEAGVLTTTVGFKVLGQGELKKALVVKANGFSQSAKTAIEAAGGKAEVI